MRLMQWNMNSNLVIRQRKTNKNKHDRTPGQLLFFLAFETMDQHFDYQNVRIELDSLINSRRVNPVPVTLKDSTNDLSFLGLTEVCDTTMKCISC